MGGEGSNDILMLSVRAKLGASLRGAYGVCKEGIAKSNT